MGYILTPVAVIGSKSRRLVSDLVEMFGSGFDQVAEMAADYADGEDDQEALTTRAALPAVLSR